MTQTVVQSSKRENDNVLGKLAIKCQKLQISPATGTISARAQAGPQSACSSIRRKSTATVMEYLSTPTASSTPTKNPMPLSRNLSSPLSTPERPLLTDMGGGSMQHIYMEVESQRGTLPPPRHDLVLAGNSNHAPMPPPPPPPAQYQPIQIPILMERVAESSNSSQSSGYYSEFLQQQRQQQHHQLQHTALVGPGLEPGFEAGIRGSSRGGGGVRPKSGFSPVVRQGVVNAAMEIQDSQMI